MTNDEAKFILSAYRPRGDDAEDEIFAAALAQAVHDPGLRVWFEKQRSFDTMITATLLQVKPPSSLRDAILAGSRVSRVRSKQHRWKYLVPWTLAAAVIVVGLGLAMRYLEMPTTSHTFALAAQRDMAEAYDEHGGNSAELAGLQKQLAGELLPLPGRLHLDPEELARRNCRSFRVNGRLVYEICFLRDDAWYHVYVARRSDFAQGKSEPQVLPDTQFACATWSDADQIYALVTKAGGNALRRVI